MSENQVQDGAASASRPKHAPGEAYQDRVEHTIALLRRENAELRQEVITLKEAVASRDAFLAVAAHELRNPMTPIVGRVQRMRAMMKRPGVTLGKLDEALVLIEWLIERYVKRATTLLDVSRINSGKMRLADEPVEICQLIRDIAASVAPLAEHAGSQVSLDFCDHVVTVSGDNLAVEQIIENLLSNAIKYGMGAPIRLTAMVDKAAGVARICVADAGPGIPFADQARIFERFERAITPGETAGGFGVGLWIVRQLSETMGGSINVASTPATGSAFTLTLPLHMPKDAI